MPPAPQISVVTVIGLQGLFDYKLSFSPGSDNILIIAPNGYGKTAFLSVLNLCLQFRLREAASKSFTELEVVFSDKTRWKFTRILGQNISRTAQRSPRYISRVRHHFVTRHTNAIVEVTFFDKSGKQSKPNISELVDGLPQEFIASALDETLPIERVGSNSFLDFQTGKIIESKNIVDKYYWELVYSDKFKNAIGPFADKFRPPRQKVNCVFIETQRLLFTKRPDKTDGEGKNEPQEEILRQSKALSENIKSTYATYAATSQDLDRTFPNRLIDAEGRPQAPDIASLRLELDRIEKKRAALTAAGILDEASTPIRPPEGEDLGNVANALRIYVEDSKTKLATFDELFSRVSVFKELMAKKLKPKELVISRETGAEVRRGDTPLLLSGLSSGEQHEFIMMFRLIFETPRGSLVLIDEPEISLHVVWQLEFMPDLQRIQAANQFQSIIATHSPQIIQNAGDITIDLADQAK